MKRKWLLLMMVPLGLAGLAGAALIGEGTTLDQMKSGDDTQYWYSTSGSNYQNGYSSGLTFTDPLDPGENTGMIRSAHPGDFSFSYKTEESKVFENVQITWMYKNTNCYVNLSYIVDGGDAVTFSPTATSDFTVSGDWFGKHYTYDFSSLGAGAMPDTITFLLHSGSGSVGKFQPDVCSVQLTATPEPATMGLLAVGGLSVLFRRKR